MRIQKHPYLLKIQFTDRYFQLQLLVCQCCIPSETDIVLSEFDNSDSPRRKPDKLGGKLTATVKEMEALLYLQK